MPCPKAIRGRHKARVNRLLARPWTHAARASRVLRKHLDNHGYITPHFSWAEMADTRGTPVPRNLRGNAIRHCWNLERFRHAIDDVQVNIDGPYRTVAHNIAVGGAQNSRHTFADASDHFVGQVSRWIAESRTLRSRADVLRIANRIWSRGGVGNEGSGTLHFDSRRFRARFVTWTAAR